MTKRETYKKLHSLLRELTLAEVFLSIHISSYKSRVYKQNYDNIMNEICRTLEDCDSKFINHTVDAICAVSGERYRDYLNKALSQFIPF